MIKEAYAVRLIAKREVTERARTKGFAIATAVFLLGVLAAIIVPALLGSEKRSFEIGTLGSPSPAVVSAIESTAAGFGASANLVPLDSPERAIAALRAHTVDVVVEGESGLAIRGEGTNDGVRDFVAQLARAIPLSSGLESAGLSPERIRALLDPAPLAVRGVIPESPENDSARGAAFLGGLVLYAALLTYGSWVGLGVLEEKSSRVVEVLLSAVRPSQLLAGKVIGIGLLGMGQLALVGITALVASALVGNGLPSVTPDAVAFVLLGFVLGFAFYSCVFAAVGAAASRQEEGQAAMGPLSAMIVVAYLVSTAVQSNPDGTLAQVSSFIPPLAPLTLPARVLLGHPPAWELPLSVALLLVATYGLVRVGARAYGGAILRFGPRIKLLEAWRSSTRDRVASGASVR